MREENISSGKKSKHLACTFRGPDISFSRLPTVRMDNSRAENGLSASSPTANVLEPIGTHLSREFLFIQCERSFSTRSRDVDIVA